VERRKAAQSGPRQTAPMPRLADINEMTTMHSQHASLWCRGPLPAPQWRRSCAYRNCAGGITSSGYSLGYLCPVCVVFRVEKSVVFFVVFFRMETKRLFLRFYTVSYTKNVVHSPIWMKGHLSIRNMVRFLHLFS